MSGDESIPIDTILLKTASRCNIACSYCYVYQLGDQGWRRQPPTMSRSTVDATVRRLDELRRAQDRDFAVVLHGGEPLLLGDETPGGAADRSPRPPSRGMHPVCADERDTPQRSAAQHSCGRRGHRFRQSRRTGEDQRLSPRGIRSGRGPSRPRSAASAVCSGTRSPNGCFRARSASSTRPPIPAKSTGSCEGSVYQR